MGYWQSAPPPKPSGVSQSWHSRRDSDGSSAPRMVALPPIDRNNRPTADLRKGRGKTLLRQGIPPNALSLTPSLRLFSRECNAFPNHNKKTPSTTALLAGRINTDHELPNCVAIGLTGLMDGGKNRFFNFFRICFCRHQTGAGYASAGPANSQKLKNSGVRAAVSPEAQLLRNWVIRGRC